MLETKSKKTYAVLLLTVYFVVSYTLMNRYGITCVFLNFLGIPCPGCGMTRAFLSLISLDFYQAAKLNVCIFFMPYLFVYIFGNFKHKIHNYLLITIALVAIVNWIYKLTILF